MSKFDWNCWSRFWETRYFINTRTLLSVFTNNLPVGIFQRWRSTPFSISLMTHERNLNKFVGADFEKIFISCFFLFFFMTATHKLRIIEKMSWKLSKKMSACQNFIEIGSAVEHLHRRQTDGRHQKPRPYRNLYTTYMWHIIKIMCLLYI